eukprot:65580_1
MRGFSKAYTYGIGALFGGVSTFAILKHQNQNSFPVQNKRFVFVRHGITNWDFDMIKEGPLDLNLNKQGIIDVEDKANKLLYQYAIKPQVIISSPLKRCVETADIFADNCKIDQPPLLLSANLEEIYRGDFSIEHKKSIEKIMQDGYSKQNENDWSEEKLRTHVFINIGKLPQPSDAEQWSDFKQRVINLEQLLYSQPTDTLIVSHGVVIKELIKYLFRHKSAAKIKLAKELLSEWKSKGTNRPFIMIEINNKEPDNIKLLL